MNQINRLHVEELLKNGYNFEIGDYISQGWEIFKKEWLTFSIYGLLTFFIIVLSAITIIGPIFVVYPLLIGFVKGADRVQRGENLSLGDMFTGFDKTGKLAMLVVLPLLIMVIMYLPILVLSFLSQGSESMQGVLLLVSAVLGLLIMAAAILFNLALFYAPYLVYFGDYEPMEALKTSFKLSKKQPLMVIAFIIIIGFINQLGMFLCGIGLFSSMALGYICYYPMLKDVLMKDETIL